MEDQEGDNFEKFLMIDKSDAKNQDGSRKKERVNIHKSQKLMREDDDNDVIDEIGLQIEELTTQILLSSLPNPGNIRSSKKKDVKMRIRCMNAMLMQRQKD